MKHEMRLLTIVVAGAALTSVADAQMSIFATQRNELLRIDGSGTSSFLLDYSITALSFDSSGRLWGTSIVDGDGDGSYSLIEIVDPFGTPVAVEVADALSARTTSIEWVGGTLYGFQNAGGGRVVTIDAGTGVDTVVGATGQTGLAGGGGMAVGPTMFALDHLAETVNDVDYTLGGGPDPSATLIGPAGLDIVKAGLDYFEGDSTLYALFSSRTGPGTSSVGLYTIDQTTGAATLHTDLSDAFREYGPSGLAIIPEPATLAMLAAGALVLARKRRS